jgi:hypothetical protein
MRTLTLAAALGLALPAAADDSPKAVVEKAITAHGGADAINKYPALKVTAKGTVSIMGMDLDVTSTSLTLHPGKRKGTATISVNGMELKLTQRISGDTVAMTLNGQELPLMDEQKAEEVAELAIENAARLTPLLKDGYTLKAGPEAAVNGEPAVGVVAEHAKHKPLTLYFDKKTGLLAKLAYKGKDDGAEVEKETIYSDYKAVQGVQVPHKEVGMKDGKKQSELTVEKVELLEKADESEFAAD